MGFSAIIPAYNEGPRIANVLRVALDCAILDEVIVVNDGSSDDTQKVIENFDHPKLQKVRLEKNGGKMKAFFSGLDRSSGESIVMIDADYIGLRTEHISRLIEPVRDMRYDSTMMMWYESLWICKLLKHDMFSGMRVVPRSVFDDRVFFLSGSGFALETKINEVLYERSMTVLSLYFSDIHNPTKGWKQLLWKQPRDILKSMPFWKVLRQAYYFYKQQP